MGRTQRSFTFTFDEPLDPGVDVAAALTLTGPGGPVEAVVVRSAGRSFTVTYPAVEGGDHALTIAGGALRHAARNAVFEDDRTIDFEVGTFTNEWTGAVIDLWNDAGNWSAGRAPTKTDDVFVGAVETPVRILGANVALSSLVATGAVVLRTRLETDFDVVADDFELDASLARLWIGTVGDFGSLRIEAGVLEGDGAVNVSERFELRSGTLEEGAC